ncbi:MAG TPA: carboxylating nicotinate-nucleotide diphosphorylase [Candidatus Borkfalkia faecipullorum]|uniref:Probable nicotinate-nucleotide pyrophosphorylase [carboxylating] n=1 Tax=Candidatus Borkfalkia faecipullorum TaxID=2838510 RepID=A0A9D1V7R6_9FIRM|nr:carboxylating nicotinate-nucleotide diphosphorylase [Candidatus Borkfalkia faecipullorum]
MIDDITMNIRADELIRSALAEDVTNEDVSTACILRERTEGQADLLCKQEGVIAGLPVFARVFTLLDAQTKVTFFAKDGDRVKKGQKLAEVRGDMRAILTGERTALNYLQRMSGIATYTANVVKLLEGSTLRLVDTRKTTPNMRIFEKYAVRVGGGGNHRYNLSDAILLKDNHIGAAGGVKAAVAMAKAYAPFTMKIEVETETLDMVKDAVEAGADIIMLDNMTHEQMKEAVEYIAHRAVVEISGNVTAESIARIKDIGADIVSSGALTHSAPILDVSLKNLHPVH